MEDLSKLKVFSLLPNFLILNGEKSRDTDLEKAWFSHHVNMVDVPYHTILHLTGVKNQWVHLGDHYMSGMSTEALKQEKQEVNQG